MGHIINEAKNNRAAAKDLEPNAGPKITPGHNFAGDDNLSGTQRQIVADIVSRHIARFCGDERRPEPAWQNYAGN